MKKMSIEDLLFLSRHKRHGVSHIKLDERTCNEKCRTKICTRVCPARSYELDDAGSIVFNHDNCLECGACRIVCPEDNVEWSLPVFGKGISYRYG